MIKKTYLPAFVFLTFFYSYIPASSLAQYAIQGRTIDQVTKEVVKNVSIIIKETKRGTASNDSGYFKLLVRLPKLTLQFSAIGYQNATKTVDLSKDDKPSVVELEKRADEMLDEVVVNATKEKSKVKSVEMSVTRINLELIKRSPLILGEADIIKALTLQPGITTAGEGAGGFNVRGGNADQNLVLIDGAPVFNSSHLLGFFAALSADAIEDVTLYKGAMPAQYGGRLSSLLNIKVKSGNTEKVYFTTGVSPVSAGVFINGPLVKDKLTFTVGGRAAYPDLILNQLPGKFGSSRAFFYDGIIKGEYSFNDKNKISLTGYSSYDRFKFDTAISYEWKSNLLSLNYISAISSKVSLRANANYSKFVSAINNLPVNYAYKLTSSIEQKQAKFNLSYALAANNKIEVGGDYVVYNISPGERKPASPTSNINPLNIQKEKGRELSGFITDEVNLAANITLQAGIRYTSYDYLGPKAVYQYK